MFKKIISKLGNGFSKLNFNNTTIQKVALEDLSREKSRLSKVKEEIFDQQEKLRKKERQLLSEGKEVDSNREKKLIASRIRDVRNESKVLDQRYNFAEKCYKITAGLYTVKENEEYYDKLGLGGVLKGIPVENLVSYIESAPDGAEDNLDQMQDILSSLSDASERTDSVLGTSADDYDSELDDIMSEFEDFKDGDNFADLDITDNQFDSSEEKNNTVLKEGEDK